MSTTITLDEASSKLREMIGAMHPGEEIRIIDGSLEVARIVVSQQRNESRLRPAPGLGKGSVLYMAPDFDDPTDSFRFLN